MKSTELRPLQIEDKIIEIRNQNVILDCDVATLYGVQTMHINQAVKNNSDKFPKGYIFEIEKQEFTDLLSKNLIANVSSKTRFLPKAFTEKGLYMLATILKSPRATQTTIAIVEAFTKLRLLANNIIMLNSIDPEVIEPEIIESTIEKTSGLLNEIFFSGLPTSAETSVEFNLGFMKGKRTVKSEGNPALQSELDALKKRVEFLEKDLTP